jgi:UDP-3-O-[3-hydroxymyristoyl] N-acetylglucosamine deacetylase/3-hydroxyacyl-[acyl-carrier-protein] dehydratase
MLPEPVLDRDGGGRDGGGGASGASGAAGVRRVGSRQASIAREASLTGVGLHTGSTVSLTFRPAEAGTGLVFVRTDLPGRPRLPVSPAGLTGGVRGTNLTVGAETIWTIEHVMAACYAAGVDNLEILLDAPEPPAADGSAAAFVELLSSAGVVTQSRERRINRVVRPVTFGDERGRIACFPSPEFRVSYTLQYANPLIGCQYVELALTPQTVAREVAPARTFCLMEEVEALRQANLALGGSLDNAIVVDGSRVLNESLRWPDEFVRHKVLDLVGDLATLGGTLQGHFVALKSGHRHNIALIKLLLEKQALLQIEEARVSYDIEDIRRVLPHRYPFLLIDRITEMEPGVRAVGLKNVTSNEQFFNGHFPGRSVMPGVLILEAMAQVAGVCILSLPEHRGKTPYFTGMDAVHFRRPVVPGDQVVIEVTVAKVRGSMGKVNGRALVESKVAAEGILKFTVI